MGRTRMAAGPEDPALVDVLVSAVETAMGEGRPLDGTRLGAALGPAYRERKRVTGPGAYRGVVDAAVASGRLRRLWWSQDRTRMALIPAGTAPPAGWSLEAPATPQSHAKATGLPQDPLSLRRDIADAFAGVRPSAVSLDVSQPPAVVVVDADAEHPAVQPVAPQAVVDAWRVFADEQKLGDVVKNAVVERLGSTAASVWARIDVPGDNAASRLGARFHRVRRRLLVEQVRQWFAERGADPALFDLAFPALSRTPDRSTEASSQNRRVDAARALRERLKGIIDRMSLEQLHELRIPVEFLDP